MRVRLLPILLGMAAIAAAQTFDDPWWQATWERFDQAYKNKQWEPAIDFATQILNRFEGKLNLKYERALCYENLGQLDKAISEFQQIVKEHPGHILSNYHLAFLLMKRPNRTDEDKQEAKKHLLEAAQYGFDALGVLESNKVFAEFANDVGYVLELIEAPKQRANTKTTDVLIDPFRELLVPANQVVIPEEPENPGGGEEPVTPEDPSDVEKQRKELLNIITLLEEIRENLYWTDEAREERAELIYQEVEELVEKVKQFTHEELADLRKQVISLYNEITEDITIVRLKRFERQASEIVEEMKLHIELSKFVEVEQDYQRLMRHLNSIGQGDKRFQDAAEQWEKKGQKWRKVAGRLREAAALQINLTGIVYGQDRDRQVAQAIINDHIRSVNDVVLDVDGTPNPKLTIRNISRNSVKFHYQGVEFTWYMKVDKPIGFAYVGEEE